MTKPFTLQISDATTAGAMLEAMEVTIRDYAVIGEFDRVEAMVHCRKALKGWLARVDGGTAGTAPEPAAQPVQEDASPAAPQPAPAVVVPPEDDAPPAPPAPPPVPKITLAAALAFYQQREQRRVKMINPNMFEPEGWQETPLSRTGFQKLVNKVRQRAGLEEAEIEW